MSYRPSTLTSLAALLTVVWMAGPALADATPPTTPASPTTTAPPAPAPDAGGDKGKEKDADKGKDKEKTKHHDDATSTEGYHRGFELIYNRGEFAAGIEALKTIGRDDDADVATLIGYASRKLGRYDDARAWYERALVSDPNHVRTWQYYGMWHLEQGNRLKAEDNLQRIQLICGGTACKEYKDLKGALDGTVTY
jgi:tetratricopeptide (TPR) repeat protein